LRTQQVIAYESDLTATVDPFAGSYAVEAMTDELEAKIRELMDTVEELGGAVAAIEAGFQKREIEQSAYEIATSVEDGSRVVVGVNRFQREDDESYEPMRGDPTIEAAQRDRLAALRAERDNDEVTRTLTALREAADGTDNVLYPMHDALRARATVGEVCTVLRGTWGVHHPTDAF
jgi:methylmalonyl-CoA mutase N-terminal domain/subunit